MRHLLRQLPSAGFSLLIQQPHLSLFSRQGGMLIRHKAMAKVLLE
ncbi:hypothetical protein BSUBE1_4150 [Bacillus subtilis E1]|uniref:Uncharacterized protein n=4 Tax=Bacillus subtilis group TaxID=653685 RepID=A0A9W5LLM3_9BACI|nr:hypothetical protein GYO_4060 [Bacillus spizizenii TU-B-10]ELS62977.1 hypothetical protein BSI_03680 [Bacillus inaquosorum KCTC 13429]EME08400.1 hypothetical protein BS732_0642 [Bacillus subtilis MB73/2]KIL30897.1 hypothetical protein B4067_4175 [Bacillus subtilis subsp. subtilis]KIU06014.1 hypothetical protein SC09_contig4orf00990 [Bacillus subtilis]CCU60781.1 hypothetical protein BSUBE1_4150 [Bacillus subtilis E1]